MKVTGNEMMTESQFLSFLVVHNLARKIIANELSNSDYVKKNGDYHMVVKKEDEVICKCGVICPICKKRNTKDLF